MLELQIAFDYLIAYWWAYLPVLLALGFYFAWTEYKGNEYFGSLDWVLLHIKPPPSVDRSPKAAEQIFAGLHGIYVKQVSWKEKFFKGKMPDWFSFEIVGEDGATNFYVRTFRDYRNIVESNIFAQYPNAEITEVDDYMKKWQATLPSEEYDVFGSELALSSADAFPIQTHPYFEEKVLGDLDAVKRLDPLASLSEVFSTFRPGETFVIQMLASPVNDDWTKKAQEELDKLLGKEAKKKKTFGDILFGPIDDILLGGAPLKKEETKEKRLSNPEEEKVKGIGRKISKIGFSSGIRIMYVAKKDVYHRYHFVAVMGAFRQFATANLNSFKINKTTLTFSKGMFPFMFPSDRGFFADQRTFKSKLRLFKKLRLRLPTIKQFMLNIEELATIFHLPGEEIKAPMFPRVEAKKGQPPAGLSLE